MDRGFTVSAAPAAVWPWIVQLGKQRAGWYLPRIAERLIPPSRRALDHIDARWQRLAVGDVIPDYGGKRESFEVTEIEPPSHLVYRSTRGHVAVSWSISLSPIRPAATRIHLRLRLGGVRHPRLVGAGGGVLDLVTIAAMAAGLAERLQKVSGSRPLPEPARP